MLKGISRCIYTVAILTFGLSAITVLTGYTTTMFPGYTDEASQQAVAAFTTQFGGVMVEMERMVLNAAKQLTMEVLIYLLDVLAAI